MTVSKALERVWEWKEQVYQDIKDMTSTERLAYFRESRRRLETKTGIKIDLPSAARRRSNG